jgi:hypothetical protein
MPTPCIAEEAIAKGDAVCVTGFNDAKKLPIVKRATHNNLKASRTVFGVAENNSASEVPAPGVVSVLVAGEVAKNDITGLEAGSSRLVVTDINNSDPKLQCKLKRIDDTNGDTVPPRFEKYVVGTCDENGNLIIQPRHTSEETGFPRVFNVRAYGAVSDDIAASAANSKAFKKAMDAMTEQGKATKTTAKLVADGHFYLSETFDIAQGIVFEGTGCAEAESNVNCRSSPGTWLVFPAGVTGIRIRSTAPLDNPSKIYDPILSSGEKTCLRNLTISCKDPVNDNAIDDCREVYDLSLTDVNTINDLPTSGRNLVIIAQVGAEKKLHIRIFDVREVKVIDKAQDSLFSDSTDRDKEFKDFKDRINSFRNSPPPKNEKEEEEVARLAMRYAEYCIPDYGCFHGIHASVPVHIENVSIQSFNHDGIHITGAKCGKTIDGVRVYDGNADGSYLENCRVDGCGRHGIHFSGGDAQACLISCCSSTKNRRAGFYDATFGNTYIGCHSAYNSENPEDPVNPGTLKPNYITKLDVNASVFINCWSEGAVKNIFHGAVTIISGKIGSSPTYMTDDSSPFSLESGLAARLPLRYKNYRGSKTITSSFGDHSVTPTSSQDTNMVALSWATLDAEEKSEDSFFLRYLDDANAEPRAYGWWALRRTSVSVDSLDVLRLPTRFVNSWLPTPWFPNGIFIGDDSSPHKVRFIGAKEILKTQFDNVTLRDYEQGDVFWNSEPSSGKPIGWVCTESGTGTLTSPPAVGTPAIFSTFGTVDSPSKSYGANQPLDLSDQYVTVTATAVITLPSAPVDGQTHSIKCKVGVATINTSDGLTIDGQPSVTLNLGEYATFRFSDAENVKEWERR